MINQNALDNWIAYRKEIKKPLRSMSIERVAKKLSNYDYDTQERMVEQSIESGWMGLFEVKQQVQKKTHEQDFIALHTCTDWSKDL